MKAFLLLSPVLFLSLAPLIHAEDKPAPSAAVAVAPVRHVTPAEAEPLINAKKVIVLDVRTPEEFAKGHIAGAKNLNFLDDSFKEKVAALDKSQSYLVHCASGGRSTRSLKAFENEKFVSILHLDGGLSAWISAGKPVE